MSAPEIKEKSSITDKTTPVENAVNHIRSITPEPVTKYNLASLILMFFAFSIIGWIWEVALYFVENGVLVNKGTLYGPWLPIYGSGGVLVIILLKKAYKKPWLVFTMSAVICTGIEYVTSWFIEATKGVRFWDYSNYFLNINGRVCIFGAVIFGLAGCVGVYYLGPFFSKWIKRIPMTLQIILCIILATAFIGDNVYSHYAPHSGKGINDYKKSAHLILSEIPSHITSDIEILIR